MPAYVIACVTDAWDQDKLGEYREGNTEAVAKHGGSFVARGGRHEILEDDYAPLRELRRSASETDIYVVEGS